MLGLRVVAWTLTHFPLIVVPVPPLAMECKAQAATSSSLYKTRGHYDAKESKLHHCRLKRTPSSSLIIRQMLSEGSDNGSKGGRQTHSQSVSDESKSDAGKTHQVIVTLALNPSRRRGGTGCCPDLEQRSCSSPLGAPSGAKSVARSSAPRRKSAGNVRCAEPKVSEKDRTYTSGNNKLPRQRGLQGSRCGGFQPSAATPALGLRPCHLRQRRIWGDTRNEVHHINSPSFSCR